MNNIKWIARAVKYIAIVEFLFIISCCGCCKSSELPICNTINDIFEKENIENCSITSLGKYDDILVKLEIPNISEKEISLYINEQLKNTGIDQLTDECVQKYFNCDNIAAYKEKVIQTLINQKKTELIMAARQQVMDELIDRSSFDIAYNAVEKYSLQIIENYKNEAYLYGMDLTEYTENVLKITYDDFFELAYEEGERLIKTYLIIGAVSYEEFGNEPYDSNEDIYYIYQELENTVYSVFIKAEDGF